MQPAFIFSNVSAASLQPSPPAAPPIRSEAQYGNEVRYLRKIIHASLGQEQSSVTATHREGEFDGLRVA